MSEKDREDRYGSAQEIARDLRKLAESSSRAAELFLRPGQMTGAVAPTQLAAKTLNPVVAPSPARLAPVATLAGAAVLIAALALVFASPGTFA